MIEVATCPACGAEVQIRQLGSVKVWADHYQKFPWECRMSRVVVKELTPEGRE